MKNLKFRAWDKFNAQYWYSEKHENLGDFFKKMQHLIDGDNDIVFEQFTGSIDKNGKEIYEGDIVKANQETIFQIEWFIDESEYCCNGFGFKTNGWLSTELDVIGNIYENPELLNS